MITIRFDTAEEYNEFINKRNEDIDLIIKQIGHFLQNIANSANPNLYNRSMVKLTRQLGAFIILNSGEFDKYLKMEEFAKVHDKAFKYIEGLKDLP